MNIDWNEVVQVTKPAPCLVLNTFNDALVREALFYCVKEVEDDVQVRTNVYEFRKIVPYILVRYPKEGHLYWLDGRYYKVLLYESEEEKQNFLTQKGLNLL